MSIRSRLEDARILWATDRKEGAFLQILVAVDATAKKRYPKLKVGERFKRFLLDEMGTITGGPRYNVAVPFYGIKTTMEHIIYTHFRCSLVHEGKMSDKLRLIEPEFHDGKWYNVMRLTEPFCFPVNWAWNTFKAVWDAPENDAECGRAATQAGSGLTCT